MGLEGINIVPLKRHVFIPRLTIWTVWPQINHGERNENEIGTRGLCKGQVRKVACLGR